MIIILECRKCLQRMELKNADEKKEVIKYLECPNCGERCDNERFTFIGVK